MRRWLRSRGLVLVSVLPAIAAASIVAGSGLGACGQGTDARAIVINAASRTTDGGTSRVAVYVAVSGIPGFGAQLGATPVVEGAYDHGRRRGRFTLDLAAFGMGGAAGKTAATKSEIVMDRSVLYLRYPSGLPGAPPAARPWVRIDLAAAAAGASPGELLRNGSGDPTAAIDLLRGAGESVRRMGEERVRRVKTMHYRTTVALPQAIRRAPTARRADLDRFADSVGRSALPIDVWIDNMGRARRISYTVDLSGAPGRRPRLTSTTELFDFGAKVDVVVPSSAEVSEMPVPSP